MFDANGGHDFVWKLEKQDAHAEKTTESAIATAIFKQNTPETVGRYLEKEGLKTRGYVSVIKQDYAACSDYKPIGEGIGDGSLQCNLAYYIEGDKSSIFRVYLNLNVNNQFGMKQGHSELLAASELLATKATGQACPQEVRQAIKAAKNGEWKSGGVTFKVVRTEFVGTLKGYSLKFQIE